MRGGALGAYQCELREVADQPVMAVGLTSPRDQIDTAVRRAVRLLTESADRRGLKAVGREIVVYDFDPLLDDDYTADVCLPLGEEADDDGETRAFVLPGCVAAVTTHHGPDDDLQSAYCSLLGWILENGFRVAGHERERYLADERDSDDPRDHVTEIMWPVATA